MKFSMKKPGVRILLLLVVLLGLAIFYFRYMREGFAYVSTATVFLDNETSTSGFTEGASCTVNVKQSKTINGKTLYCCAGKWISKSCPSPTELTTSEIPALTTSQTNTLTTDEIQALTTSQMPAVTST